jgi:hypothetical protein
MNPELHQNTLPPDVCEKVVWRDRFWLPDEALGVFTRSAGLFGSEMHSPIMCIGSGIPAIVCRWSEQSSKAPNKHRPRCRIPQKGKITLALMLKSTELRRISRSATEFGNGVYVCSGPICELF